MNKSFKLYWFYFFESLNAFRSDSKLYFAYIVSLSLVSMLQNGMDIMFSKDKIILRIISKLLFSIIPIMILSKILYVIKIRHFGLDDYKRVLWQFWRYSFIYFALISLAFCFYFISSLLVAKIFPEIKLPQALAYMSFLLLPVIYMMIFYSLSPFVAVFEDDLSDGVLFISKKLSKKALGLVVTNHIVSLFAPIIFSLVIMINNPLFKFYTALILSIPEAILSVLMILTTSRIYLYLKQID